MDNNAKVMLSEGELAMACDKDIILTKQVIILKAGELFNTQIASLSTLFKEIFAEDGHLLAAVPKIFKGENYKDFPYVIMDYPAKFSKQNIFALRTMFWWGNYITITLHLKGTYKEKFAATIIKNVRSQSGVFISIGENEWQHDLQDGNYIKSNEITEEEIINILNKSFFKIAIKYELHHWNMMQSLLPEGYKNIKNLLVC